MKLGSIISQILFFSIYHTYYLLRFEFYSVFVFSLIFTLQSIEMCIVASIV